MSTLDVTLPSNYNGCFTPLWDECVEQLESVKGGREGIIAEITGGNWTPSVCTGMSRQGESESTEE
ncbi:hypothetical protein INR49_021881, partial [Caranx melampygus]